jgi:uncharacterized small protein (DUF1192 family)
MKAVTLEDLWHDNQVSELGTYYPSAEVDERIKALEAERDRLRASHAALVEAAEAVTGWVWIEILRYAQCDSSEIQSDIDKLKAALAEVKG